MAYDASPSSTHNPATGGTPTAAWGDIINGNFEAIGGAWTAFTPTWTNLTVGNGTVEAAYLQWGKRVEVRGRITFGTTTSVSGGFTASLPVAPKAGTFMIGVAKGEDASAASARTVGCVDILSSVWGTAVAFASTGNGGWNATAPFTWTTDDVIVWHVTYEAA